MEFKHLFKTPYTIVLVVLAACFTVFLTVLINSFSSSVHDPTGDMVETTLHQDFVMGMPLQKSIPMSDVSLYSEGNDRRIPQPVCNEVTSSPIVTKHLTGHLRTACRCHWPTLFGQKTLFEDCSIQHACDGGIGVLVHKITRKPLTEAVPPIDIHDYECSECARCNLPGPDPHTGLPSCLPRMFNDRDGDMCLYGVSGSESEGEDDEMACPGQDLRSTKPMLSLNSPFIDKMYRPMFTDRVRDTARVPNPCAFDTFSGVRLNGECELRMTRSSKIAYCAPMKDNAMTAVAEDTYLSNNQGKYPNACFRFTSNETHVNGYVIEYFLRERRTPQLPSPVVSMRVAKGNVLISVLKGLGLLREPDDKMLLFTQPEPPADVSEFPHPFNKQRLAAFKYELNNWIEWLPAVCLTPALAIPAAVTIDLHHIPYNCSAPVQRLAIPDCSRIGENDRQPFDRDRLSPLGAGDQTKDYAKSTVACLNPQYDSRFPIVPNYNVSVGSTNAEPTSAILFFDKTNNTVYPHWKNVGANITAEKDTIARYVREKLRSLPNET